MNKVCTQCKIIKKLDDFPIKSSSNKKYASACKSCKSEKDKITYRNKNFTPQERRNKYKKIKKYQEWYRKHKYQYNAKSARQSFKKYAIKYPEKIIARRIVRNAIRQKVLIKKSCIVCKNIKTDGHHENYAKPLKVIWLCRKHHLQWHTYKKWQSTGDEEIKKDLLNLRLNLAPL